jgi:hypothetical protein
MKAMVLMLSDHLYFSSDPALSDRISVYTAVGNHPMNHRTRPSGLVDPHIDDVKYRMRGPMRDHEPTRKQTETGHRK